MATSLCPQSAAISPEPVKADHSIQSLCEAWRKEPRAERSNGPGDHVPRVVTKGSKASRCGPARAHTCKLY